ncbi:MAG: plasmid stabilization protein [Desulfuromonadales bacterium GWC2_61_20]|nr:MAG: plasmid stabilization protein [Desulfuromonadales bacterium GWC2_61_20]HAD03488.1 plasmid stabilization protein [Desulfuromonas sp.]
MTWRVIYHHEVADDLEALGRYAARAVLKAIEERIRDGEPEKSGKPLSGELAGCRRIRSGDVRIVYRVDGGIVEVLIIAVGPRRNDEVYRTARKRV